MEQTLLGPTLDKITYWEDETLKSIDQRIAQLQQHHLVDESQDVSILNQLDQIIEKENESNIDNYVNDLNIADMSLYTDSHDEILEQKFNELIKEQDLLKTDFESSFSKQKINNNPGASSEHLSQFAAESDYFYEPSPSASEKVSPTHSPLRSSVKFDDIMKQTPYKELASIPENTTSRVVISALRTLQDKIARLETERLASKDRIQALENDLAVERSKAIKAQVQYSPQKRESLDEDRIQALVDEKLVVLHEHVQLLESKLEDERARISQAQVPVEKDDLNKQLDQLRIQIQTLERELHEEKTRSKMDEQLDVEESKSEPLQKEPSPIFEKSPVREIEQTETKQVQTNKEQPFFFDDCKLSIKDSVADSDDQSFNIDVNRLRFEMEQERQCRSQERNSESRWKKAEKSLDRSLVGNRKSRVLSRSTSTDSLAVWKDSDESIWKADQASEKRAWKDIRDIRWKEASQLGRSTKTTKPTVIRNSRPLSSQIAKKRPLRKPREAVENQFQNLVGNIKVGREMPFIAGGNPGKSFSLTANIQKVFSLLKNHSSQHCSRCSRTKEKIHSCDKQSENNRRLYDVANDINRSFIEHVKSTQEEQEQSKQGLESLSKVLADLEEEYGTMRYKYHQLVDKYERISVNFKHDPNQRSLLKPIGDDLSDMVESMEVKNEQIQIIRDILNSSVSYLNSLETRDPLKNRLTRNRSESPGRAQTSLSLLKSTIKVQDALLHS